MLQKKTFLLLPLPLSPLIFDAAHKSERACSFLYIVTSAAAPTVWRGAIMYLREMNNGRGRIVLQDLLRLLHNLPWGENFREASHAIDKLFVPAWGAQRSRRPPTSTPRCRRRCWQTLQPLIAGVASWSLVSRWGLSTWKWNAVWIYLVVLLELVTICGKTTISKRWEMLFLLVLIEFILTGVKCLHFCPWISNTCQRMSWEPFGFAAQMLAVIPHAICPTVSIHD